MVKLRLLEPRVIRGVCYIAGDVIESFPRLAELSCWLGIAERVADEPAEPVTDVPQVVEPEAINPEATESGDTVDGSQGSEASLDPVLEGNEVGAPIGESSL